MSSLGIDKLGSDQPSNDQLANDQLLEQLSVSSRAAISDVWVLDSVDSTNNYLLQQAKKKMVGFQVCLADMQHAGRGRRGKNWFSPPGASLYLSVSTRLNSSLNDLSGLGLMAAVVVAQVLKGLGVSRVGIKWPNDIFFENKKLGGILVDASSGTNGSSFVVIGLGLNINLPAGAENAIDQPWQDLKHVLGEQVPERNVLAGLCAEALMSGLKNYEQKGLKAFSRQFEALDIIKNAAVKVCLEHESFEGVAVGVNALGMLLVESQQGLRELHSGDVSIKRR
ncbi:MAG: biotin--[acetyl-CoA-carboxylase] ligase [Gammaproteobacteria bacterium]|nr:biotin--[acetyl-CoA-carboxylase] ligase [Gammaproteobacteria bacterium]